ncbi:MAG: DUF4352 domain-containing protein [Bacilli bacterium]
MKKLANNLILCLSLLVFITGCNQLKPPINNKTVFYLNEEAKIDHFKITLNDILEKKEFNSHKPSKGIYLVLEFKIENISNEEQTIDNNSFILDIANDKYLDLNNKNISKLAAKESLMYKVVYDAPLNDDYNINFYSGVVSNNITFITK